MPSPSRSGCPKDLPLAARISHLANEDSILVITGEPGSGKTDLAARIHAAGPYRNSRMRSMNFALLKDRDQRFGLFGVEPPEISSRRRGILEHPTTQLIKHIDNACPYLQDRLAIALREKRVERFAGSERLPVLGRAIFTLRLNPEILHDRGRITPHLFEVLDRAALVSLADRDFAPDGETRHTFFHSLATHPHEEVFAVLERDAMREISRMINERREFPLKQTLAIFEREIVERVLRMTGRNVVQAAHLLGVTEHTIRRIIQRPFPSI